MKSSWGAFTESAAALSAGAHNKRASLQDLFGARPVQIVFLTIWPWLACEDVLSAHLGLVISAKKTHLQFFSRIVQLDRQLPAEVIEARSGPTLGKSALVATSTCTSTNLRLFLD